MKKKLAIVLSLWILGIFILNKFGLFDANLESLIDLFNNLEDYKIPTFLVLSTFRILTLLPSALFMILGGLIFNPSVALLLSILSVILSESILYLISKSLFAMNLDKHFFIKNPRLQILLEENKSKILFLGVLCPLAPTDMLCVLGSSAGISYFRYVIIVASGNLPMISLYSFLGNSLVNSWFNAIFLIISIIIFTIFSLHLWKSAQYETKH